jgi:hypothetical protein
MIDSLLSTITTIAWCTFNTDLLQINFKLEGGGFGTFPTSEKI